MKRKFLAIVPVVALLGAMFGYAASLDIGAVDNLGAGTEVISPPAIEVTGIEWVVNPNNYLQIRRVDISLVATDGQWHNLLLYLVLKDAGGSVIQQWSNDSFGVNGVGGEYQWMLNPYVPAADIAQFAITIIEAVP